MDWKAPLGPKGKRFRSLLKTDNLELPLPSDVLIEPIRPSNNLARALGYLEWTTTHLSIIPFEESWSWSDFYMKTKGLNGHKNSSIVGEELSRSHLEVVCDMHVKDTQWNSKIELERFLIKGNFPVRSKLTLLSLASGRTFQPWGFSGMNTFTNFFLSLRFTSLDIPLGDSLSYLTEEIIRGVNVS